MPRRPPISTETSQAHATSTEFCRVFADNISADTFTDDPLPAGEVLAEGFWTLAEMSRLRHLEDANG
jgi:hypothetical protein